MVLRGGGTRSDLGRPPDRADLSLDLRELAGIIEHHGRDLTVEAWAGTTVAELNRTLRPTGQLLPLDPPFPERATLGGVIAAGEPGIRTVPGARPGDLLLGFSAVLADGTRIRSGGRVVKNVTGYQLTRLFTGSLGTLGAITRVTLRLRALPEASRTVVVPLPGNDSAAEFADRALAAAGAATDPEALAIVPPGTGLPGLPENGGFHFAARFAGLREEAEAPVDELVRRAGGAHETLEGSAEAAFWSGARDFSPAVPRARSEVGIALRGPEAGVLRTAWRLASLGPPIVYGTQRRALASFPPASFPRALRLVAREAGVRMEVQTGPPGFQAAHPVFTPPLPQAVGALSRRIREALDPAGVLAPGRTPF